jgi:hypothetical protein
VQNSIQKLQNSIQKIVKTAKWDKKTAKWDNFECHFVKNAKQHSNSRGGGGIYKKANIFLKIFLFFVKFYLSKYILFYV